MLGTLSHPEVARGTWLLCNEAVHEVKQLHHALVNAQLFAALLHKVVLPAVYVRWLLESSSKQCLDADGLPLTP